MDGYTCFMSGFGEGVDQYFAEIVLEKQKDNPALELIAVIPYRKRLERLKEKGRTYKMLETCLEVIVIEEKISPKRLFQAEPVYDRTLWAGDCRV